MHIKTLSEIFNNKIIQAELSKLGFHLEMDGNFGRFEALLPRASLFPDPSRMVWDSIRLSIQNVQPTKASFVKDLGAHSIEPMQVLTMFLLNLSPKDVSELRVMLGIQERTPL